MLSSNERAADLTNDDRNDFGAQRQILDELLQELCGRVAPFWPLANFIAVNPLQGFEDTPFAEVNTTARKYFRARGLPKLEYFREQFRKGRIRYETLLEVVRTHGNADAPETIARLLVDGISVDQETDIEPATAESEILTLTEWSDRLSSTRLEEAIGTELFKWCSSYFDLGEAAWTLPGKELGFYSAWKQLARFDRNFELAGISAFRTFVDALPEDPESAIFFCLNRMGVPPTLWRDYLLRHLCATPGWSGLFRHFGLEGEHADGARAVDPLLAYLAVRLAYDCAGAESVIINQRKGQTAWSGIVGMALERYATHHVRTAETAGVATLLWLEAFEKEYRDGLLAKLGRSYANSKAKDVWSTTRPHAQAIFCIDVRSECLRRHLEATGPIETFGFAGFFAIPLAFRPFAEDFVQPACPVLIRPKYVVADRLVAREKEPAAKRQRKTQHAISASTKEVKNTGIAPFAFVETFGFWGAAAMFLRAFAPRWLRKTRNHRGCEVSLQDDSANKSSMYTPGIPLPDRIAIAENAMRLMGLGANGSSIARLVLVCGHGSTTTNNAYASALDCGACGGHRGAPNARVAAAIFNDPQVREALKLRNLLIPEDTYFLAAEHDTATDRVEIYQSESVPASHADELRELQTKLQAASTALNLERTQRFDRKAINGTNAMAEVQRRSQDWSEARPEWGLAGNAAFIVAHRNRTRDLDLEGRAFLHSYRWETDPEGSALETIMTAPMIVTEWINTQYYFSSVDNARFGSGNKTIQNVIGKLGVMEGNHGDLRVGLPIQSVSDGTSLVHEPMRLCVLIEAPKERIGRIIEKHASVSKLLKNGWLRLIAIDPRDDKAYRYAPDAAWQLEAAFR